LLANSSNPLSRSLIVETQAAARSVGLQIEIADVSDASNIEAAFANLRQREVQGLVVAPDTLFINRRADLATLALRYSMPAIFPFREDVLSGGLMSYGPSITDNARMAGVYAGRVLRGESPANLPVVQPTKFELVINLKAAKALSVVEIPPTLLTQAEEVIE
jgi:putative ABC transport system substrate-binding protein